MSSTYPSQDPPSGPPRGPAPPRRGLQRAFLVSAEGPQEPSGLRLWAVLPFQQARSASRGHGDVLQRIETHPALEVHLLTPRLWKENFAHAPLTSALRV